MKRTLIAALLVGAATGIAAGQTTAPPVELGTVTDLGTGKVTVVYDEALTKEFEISREIIDRIQAEFGESAVYDNGQDLPDSIDAALEPGNMLPEDIEVSAVPDKLGDLPTLGEGRWVAVGDHLVEVSPDNRIVMVLYDALP